MDQLIVEFSQMIFFAIHYISFSPPQMAFIVHVLTSDTNTIVCVLLLEKYLLLLGQNYLLKLLIAICFSFLKILRVQFFILKYVLYKSLGLRLN